jgi:hypothetical protein
MTTFGWLLAIFAVAGIAVLGYLHAWVRGFKAGECAGRVAEREWLVKVEEETEKAREEIWRREEAS